MTLGLPGGGWESASFLDCKAARAGAVPDLARENPEYPEKEVLARSGRVQQTPPDSLIHWMASHHPSPSCHLFSKGRWERGCFEIQPCS